MIADLFDLDKLRRAIIYTAYILVTLLFQTMLFSRITVLGVRAMFVPAAITALGMFEGGEWGGFFGLLCGILLDMSLGTTALFTVLLPIVGFGAGVLGRFVVNRSLFSFLCTALAAFILTAAFQMFRLLVFKGQDAGALMWTALLQTLWSLPLAPPFFYICRALSRKKLD